MWNGAFCAPNNFPEPSDATTTPKSATTPALMQHFQYLDRSDRLFFPLAIGDLPRE